MRVFYPLLSLVLLCIINGVQGQSAHSYEGVRTIIIDAGHGGFDPGNLGTGRYASKEKDISLAVSLKVGAYLKSQLPDVNVVYTRQSDRKVTLERRAELANEANGDIFVSIHCDAFTSPNAFGATTLVLGRNHGQENRIALQENAAIMLEEDYEQRYQGFDPANPESAIGLYMIQGVYLNESIQLAKMIQDQFRERVQRRDRGVKQQPLYVTSRVAMPAVLVELGFLTNPEEEDYLNSEKGQDYLASAIFRAIRDYKLQKEALLSELNAAKPQSKPLDSKEESRPTSPSAKEDHVPAKIKTDPVAIQNSSQDEKEISFAVQILTLSKSQSLSDPIFKGESIFAIEEDGLYKYFVGKQNSFGAAAQEMNRLRQKGFKGAFVVGFEGMRKISAVEAKRKAK